MVNYLNINNAQVSERSALELKSKYKEKYTWQLFPRLVYVASVRYSIGNRVTVFVVSLPPVFFRFVEYFDGPIVERSLVLEPWTKSID